MSFLLQQAKAAGVNLSSRSEAESFLASMNAPSGEVQRDPYGEFVLDSISGGLLGPAAHFFTGGGAAAAKAAGASVPKALGKRLVSEVGSEIGAGLGMATADTLDPDNPVTSLLASLAGGMAGGVAGGALTHGRVRGVGKGIADKTKSAADKAAELGRRALGSVDDAPVPKPVGDDVLAGVRKRLNDEIIQVDDPVKAMELSLATKKTVRDVQGRLYEDGMLKATPGNSQNLTDLAPERPGVIEPAPKATDIPSEEVTPVRSDPEVSTEVPAVREAPSVAPVVETPSPAPVVEPPDPMGWKAKILEAIKKNESKAERGPHGLSKSVKKRLEDYSKDLPPGPDDAEVIPGAGSWGDTVYPEYHSNTVIEGASPVDRYTQSKTSKVIPGKPFAPASEKTAADALSDLLPDAPMKNKPAYAGAELPSYAKVEYTQSEQKAVKAVIGDVLQDVDASNGVDILSKIKNNDGSYEGFFNQMDGEDVFEKLLELISNKAGLPRSKVRSILYGLADAEGTTKYGLRTNGSKDTLRDPWVVGILRQADDFDAAARSNPYKGPLIEQAENAADKPAMHKINGERVPAVDSIVESLGTHHGDKNVYEWFKPLNDNPDFIRRYRERPKDGVVPGFFADADTMMTTHDVDVIGPNSAANYLLARQHSGDVDELMKTAEHIVNTWTEAKVKAMGGLAPDEAVSKQWIESGYGVVQNKAGDLLDISPLMLKEKAHLFPGMYEKALAKVAKDLDLPRDYVEYALENLSKKMDTNAATKASLTQYFDPNDPRLQAAASEKVARQGAARGSLDAGADIGEGPLPGAMQNAGLTDHGKVDLEGKISSGAKQRAKLEAEASMYEEAINAVKIAESLGLNAKESRRLLVESVGARTGLKGDALLNEVEAILRDAKAMDNMGSSGGARKALSDSVAKRTGLSGEELEKEVRGIINDLNAPLSLAGNKKEARRMLIASVEARTGLTGQALRDEVRGILNDAREIPADVRLANNTTVRSPETMGERIMAKVAVGKQVDINQLKAYPDSDGLRSSKGAHEALQGLIVDDSKAGLKLEDTLIATSKTGSGKYEELNPHLKGVDSDGAPVAPDYDTPEQSFWSSSDTPEGGSAMLTPDEEIARQSEIDSFRKWQADNARREAFESGGKSVPPEQALTEAHKAIAAERQTRLREARKIAWNLKNADEIQSYSKISEAMDAVSEPVRRELEELLLEPNFKPHKFVATLENELAISAHAYKNALPGGLTHKERENVLLRKVVERYGDKPTQGAIQETIDSLPPHLREQLLEIAKSPKAAGGAEKRALAKMELWKYGKIAYEKAHGKFNGATMGFLGGGFGDADISSVALSFARKFMDIKAGISKKALAKVDEIYHGTDLIKRLGGGEIERLSESFDKATVRKLLHLASHSNSHGALDVMNIPAQTKENLKKMGELLAPFLQREFGDSDMGHLFDKGYFVRSRHQVKVSPNAAGDFIYGMVKDGYFSSSTLDNSVEKAAKLFQDVVSGSPRSEGYKKA
ncbi:MAG: hypothetical protein EOM02_00290, partial [Synergistales bacterium]|nr:hypothetical protein [Synergistales bacterium]